MVGCGLKWFHLTGELFGPLFCVLYLAVLIFSLLSRWVTSASFDYNHSDRFIISIFSTLLMTPQSLHDGSLFFNDDNNDGALGGFGILMITFIAFFSKERSISPSPSSAYLGQSQSRRSSVQSVNGLSEPQEVSSIHVNFVKDNSRYWYKPNIAREDGITT